MLDREIRIYYNEMVRTLVFSARHTNRRARIARRNGKTEYSNALFRLVRKYMDEARIDRQTALKYR